MVRTALGVLAFVAGCDVVFPPGGHDPPTYSLALTTTYVGNRTVEAPTDFVDGETVYLVEDPAAPDGFARIPAFERTPGTVSAEVLAEGASVMFRVPGSDYTRVWSMPVRDVVGRATFQRRPDATPGDTAATIQIDTTLATQFFTGRLEAYVVGAWVAQRYAGADLPAAGSTDFDVAPRAYDAFTSVTSDERWRITADDQALLLRYDINETLVGALAVPAFDQGPATTLTGMISTVALDQQIAFEIDPAASDRAGAVRPAVGTASQSWTIHAAPGLAAGVATGPVLAYQVVQPGQPPAATATYGNPFDWPAAVRAAWSGYRGITPMDGSLPVFFYAGVLTIAAAEDGLVAHLDAPIPTRIALGGTPLDPDNITVPIERSRPVEISATFDRDAPGVFVATLYALEDAETGYAKVVVAEAVSTVPRWRVPEEIFDGGGRYFIRVLEYVEGLAAFADGDLRLSPPVTVGYLDSGLFYVP